MWPIRLRPDGGGGMSVSEAEARPDAPPAELLMETSGGEKVYRDPLNVTVRLPPGRRVLSTSWLNGGFLSDPMAVINHHVDPRPPGGEPDIEWRDLPDYLSDVCRGLGLDPARTAALMTAADMPNACASVESFRGLEVTAVSTAGIEANGGRAGDPASYWQTGRSDGVERTGGTINTILVIGADLPDYSMARAIVTAAEAKAAALQDLMARSRFSHGVATGSGTDMIAVCCDRTSGMKLSDSGKHSKLGECIGRAVMDSVTRALDLQNGLNPMSQRDAMVRLERYGIGEAEVVKAASMMLGGERRPAVFKEKLRELSKNPVMVASVASALHIVDEVERGLVPEQAGARAAASSLSGLPSALGIQPYGPGVLRTDGPPLETLIRAVAHLAKHYDPGRRP